MAADTQPLLQKAREHHEAGRLSEAEEIYRQILSAQPDEPQTLYMLGVLAGQRGHHDQAQALLERAVAADPSLAEAYFNLGLSLVARGEDAKAIEAFRAVIRIKPNVAAAYSKMGQSLSNIGQLDEGLEVCQTAVRIQPDSAECYADLGILLLKKKWQEQAVAACRRAISLRPGFATAYNTLGNALRNLGQFDEAITAFTQAIELRPGLAGAHCNLGAVLREKGRADEACAASRQAIVLNPGLVEAHITLGNALLDLGRLNEAEAAYVKAVELEPNRAQIHSNLGVIYTKLGRVDEAVAVLRRAIELDPKLVEAHSNLCVALKDQGRLEEAVAVGCRAVEIDPGFASAHANLGIAYLELDQFNDAVAAHSKAVELDANNARAHSNLGVALKESGQLGTAIAALRRAIELDPKLSDAYVNLGATLMRQGTFDQAITACQRAIELRPDFAEAYNNLGNAFKGQGKLDKAMESFRRAIELDPEIAAAHFNLAMSQLLEGDMDRGWAEYEWRWKCKDMAAGRRNFTQPTWDGGDLTGRTILLLAEQGLGDTIQFIRYAPLVKARGGRVIVECQAPLMRLLAQAPGGIPGKFPGEFPGELPGVDQWVPRGEPLPPFDVHCYLLGLPLAFKTRPSTLPAQAPLLSARPDWVDPWRVRMNGLGLPSGLKVGLVWAGSPTHKNDSNRSIQLEMLTPLSRVRRACFVSLQKGPAAEQIKSLPPEFQLADWTADLNDFADTAALIANLDMVICVDTSVAHLAGAMGKPVWVLLPFAPDWRWLLKRNDSPWYPSMRLFRQPSPGDWATPIAQIAEELAAITSANTHKPSSKPHASSFPDLQSSMQKARKLSEAGRVSEAEQVYQQILARLPQEPQALFQLGILAGQAGRHGHALELFTCSVAADPGSAEANFNLGIALAAHDSHAMAAEAFRATVAIDPQFHMAYINMGVALAKLGRQEKAIAAFDAALALCPDDADAHSHMGVALMAQGKPDKALDAYQRAIELNPNLAKAHWNMAICLLLQGDMARGWVEYECRHKCKDLAADSRKLSQPSWNGGDLAGRRILLRSEAGLGDTIQFIRYAPLVHARGGRVIVECQAPLVRLLKQIPGLGVEQWIPCGSPLPPFDLQCQLMSLPLAFGTKIETLPAYPSWLRAEATWAEQWRGKVAGLGPPSMLKVGLAWAGNPDHKNDANRSMKLERLAPLAQTANVKFVSLQKGAASGQSNHPPAGLAVVDWTAEIKDFADTAALIANLDLVICVDTAVAHLAGAMGKPVWVLLPFAPDWRWMLGRRDSPWYPSMKLFRQPSPGDWATPIAQIARELEAMAAVAKTDHANPAPSAQTQAALQFAREHHEAGRLREAESIYREILARQSNEPRVLHLLGLLVVQSGRHDQALELFGRAVAADPASSEANFNYGIALAARGDHAKAADAFRAAITINPGNVTAQVNLGVALSKLHRHDEAIAAYLATLALRSDYADAYSNLGVSLKEQGRIDEAIAAYQKALQLDPKLAKAHCNLGVAYLEQGRLDEALAVTHRALALDPGMASAHRNLSICHLLKGDLAPGWREYEWRLKCTDMGTLPRSFAEPAWDGGDLAGRTILLHAEQGLGDTIQLIRFVPQVKARGGKVIVECAGALMRLFKQVQGADQWVIRGQPLPPFDLQAYLMSLPLILGATTEKQLAYPFPLRPEPDLVERWRSRVAGLGPPSVQKVGLTWAGNPEHGNDRNRSTRLELLAPLARSGQIRFVSLQKGQAGEQARNPPPGMNIVDWTAELHDLADTAALIANLDLVICVDTCMAHLAGAMGKPVWVLLPFAPDWRWMVQRSDSPWYPSMRLFRQPRKGDWATPIAQIAAELAALDPDAAQAQINLSGELFKKGRLEEAVTACERAIKLRPDLADAHKNLGNALKELGRHEQAINAYERAIELKPDRAVVHANLGNVLLDQDRFAEAEAAYDRALELDPNLAQVHFNLAHCLLLRGDLARGWREYEWRLKCKDQAVIPRRFSVPAWDGRELSGRRILIHAEQGLGDTLQFIRYVPLVRDRGGRIMVECQPELVRLFENMKCADQWIPAGRSLPPFDVHCSLMSLPLLMGTMLENIPACSPPLQAQADRVDSWRDKVAGLGPGLKIGLAWSGNKIPRNDRTRSLELELLAPLSQTREAHFVSLQKGAAAEQVRILPAGIHLTDWTAKLNDFADTAALVANLDLVICIDTSVAHLAGAMGKPVWVLLPFRADWRWLLKRSDSPWYPSMRLFRQPSPEDWATPIAQVAKELTAMTS